MEHPNPLLLLLFANLGMPRGAGYRVRKCMGRLSHQSAEHYLLRQSQRLSSLHQDTDSLHIAARVNHLCPLCCSGCRRNCLQYTLLARARSSCPAKRAEAADSCTCTRLRHVEQLWACFIDRAGDQGNCLQLPDWPRKQNACGPRAARHLQQPTIDVSCYFSWQPSLHLISAKQRVGARDVSFVCSSCTQANAMQLALAMGRAG